MGQLGALVSRNHTEHCLVQFWFRFGSHLAQVWLGMVHRWFRFGSDSVRSGLARLGLKAGCGSDVVQVWLGWAQRRFRSGSGLVQMWFRFGAVLVQNCFRFKGCPDSGRNWIRFGPYLEQIWVRFGSVGLNHMPDSFQNLFRIGSGLVRHIVDSELVQNWIRISLEFVQNWTQNWFRLGSELVQSWS